MEQTLTELREARLQKLFDDCRTQVISQIIGPFGLSMAMFEDKNGGNVTTLHNFERDDSDYVATKSDEILYAKSREEYDRSQYEIDKGTWEEKREEKLNKKVDDYTGRNISEGDLDHVVPIKEVHDNKKNHLALGQVTDGSADVSRIRAMVNHDENLALTDSSANRSKGAEDLQDWAKTKRKDGQTNTEKYGLNQELVDKKYAEAREHIDKTANWALFEKQSQELLITGGKQAALMGVRQAVGLLLTEIVNGLFNEFKVLIQQGVEQGKTLLQEIQQRLIRTIKAAARKIPDALSQMFQGGISGFVSNLLTFLLNNFLSTAKRFVTIIREGLLSLFRAFKLIFFPPKHMTADEALQAGLKILSTAVITAIGALLTETVGTFLASVPFLKPLADLITPVLMGILTGLLSAFLAYQIDKLFDRYRHSMSEKFMDELLADAKRRDAFADELLNLTETSVHNIESYYHSISRYHEIGALLERASASSAAALSNLTSITAETQELIEQNHMQIEYINKSQEEIEEFLRKI
ncbi:hypothetical protein [Elstera cyanobacteriorum]|uniref:hypothetical protein n=1 Tax=Elstera cyanobacteriorum TaxID=2022747 RepID=UPI002353A6F5|nr:hypothetical protein [Elstera cyanobacteriorum]MCK6444698.1 hypothetical protein [Elstera cyanobacteriorum]